MTSTRTVRPFLKWAGGKQALANTLIGHFPRDFDRYYEPFLGGGSILLALGHAPSVAGDANTWLIDTYEAVRDDPAAVTAILDRFENTAEEYAVVRAHPPELLDRVGRAAQFIYLNKRGFRGLFRVNRQGRFNVPYGAYDRPSHDPSHLEAVSSALRDVEFRRGDFADTLEGVMPDDFVYLDPPYFKLGGHSDFDRYTPGKFGAAEHVRLAETCLDLDARGVRWALSNSDTPLVRNLYAGYHARVIASRREINLSAAKRDMHELLITNY